MVRLRFNLGRGDNYRKWQLKTYEGKEVISKEHFDPDEVVILLEGATLKNRKSQAEKIYNGKNKSVCAWITADKATVYRIETGMMFEDSPIELGEFNNLKYNPRVAPHWRNISNRDMDNVDFDLLITRGTEIFDISEQVETLTIN